MNDGMLSIKLRPFFRPQHVKLSSPRIFPDNSVNTIITNNLAPCVTRTSAANALLEPEKNGSLTYTSGHFYLNGLTFIPAWKSNHMPSKMWAGIAYSFLNFNGGTVEV